MRVTYNQDGDRFVEDKGGEPVGTRLAPGDPISRNHISQTTLDGLHTHTHKHTHTHTILSLQKASCPWTQPATLSTPHTGLHTHTLAVPYPQKGTTPTEPKI